MEWGWMLQAKGAMLLMRTRPTHVDLAGLAVSELKPQAARPAG